ncbi:hypothetical protein STAFG_7520 [Streptomyces afghaniensis 772]|uniref:Uncharacterized protein n=1 Tax=Streptomyces afghaniensis 772 TaxID=1283301 RepID=S4MPS1_9ACTN|nr:hypothetical protein STAFG_7520 [Streptomyces afghaniensis 772]
MNGIVAATNSVIMSGSLVTTLAATTSRSNQNTVP